MILPITTTNNGQTMIYVGTDYMSHDDYSFH